MASGTITGREAILYLGVSRLVGGPRHGRTRSSSSGGINGRNQGWRRIWRSRSAFNCNALGDPRTSSFVGRRNSGACGPGGTQGLIGLTMGAPSCKINAACHARRQINRQIAIPDSPHTNKPIAIRRRRQAGYSRTIRDTDLSARDINRSRSGDTYMLECHPYTNQTWCKCPGIAGRLGRTGEFIVANDRHAIGRIIGP